MIIAMIATFVDLPCHTRVNFWGYSRYLVYLAVGVLFPSVVQPCNSPWSPLQLAEECPRALVFAKKGQLR